jgi:hypothetical protein
MKHARSDYDRIQDPEGLIPEDEPVFLVRGQDVAGPETLRAWASEATRLGAGPEIVERVVRHAEAMEDWQQSRAFKVPDLPPGA